MKFSNAAVATMLAASASAQAIPVEVAQDTGMEKRADIDDVIGAIQNLVDVLNTKRDLDVAAVDYAEMLKRDVDWGALIQKVLGALPGLIKTIWDSGIIQQVFSAIWNNQGIRDGIFNGIKWVLNAILGLFTKSSGTAATAGQAQAKRMLAEIDRLQSSNDLSARDFADTIGSIIKAIWNSGIIQSIFNYVINWIKTNPDQFQNLLKSALSVVTSLVSSIWNWAKENGYIEKAFQWLGANIGTILTQVINFILSLFGRSDGAVQTTAPATAPASTGAPKQKKRDINRLY